MPDIASELDKILFDKVMEHLAKIKNYVPGPVKKVGGVKAKLQERYSEDPLFSIFGLDSPEYITATLAGGTVTSIHRKLGDIYEDAVASIFVHRLGLTYEDVIYSATLQSGDATEERSADAYLQFDKLRSRDRRRIEAFCRKELKKLTSSPQINLIGVGLEVRHCYATGDSKRAQADEAMGRHFLLSGILPVVPFFCNQSNPSIIRRYRQRSIWVVKEGIESYQLIRSLSGYNMYDFMQRNRHDFRQPVIDFLGGLTK
jgi:hypothetical protein